MTALTGWASTVLVGAAVRCRLGGGATGCEPPGKPPVPMAWAASTPSLAAANGSEAAAMLVRVAAAATVATFAALALLLADGTSVAACSTHSAHATVRRVHPCSGECGHRVMDLSSSRIGSLLLVAGAAHQFFARLDHALDRSCMQAAARCLLLHVGYDGPALLTEGEFGGHRRQRQIPVGAARCLAARLGAHLGGFARTRHQVAVRV